MIIPPAYVVRKPYLVAVKNFIPDNDSDCSSSRTRMVTVLDAYENSPSLVRIQFLHRHQAFTHRFLLHLLFPALLLVRYTSFPSHLLCSPSMYLMPWCLHCRVAGSREGSPAEPNLAVGPC